MEDLTKMKQEIIENLMKHILDKSKAFPSADEILTLTNALTSLSMLEKNEEMLRKMFDNMHDFKEPDDSICACYIPAQDNDDDFDED